MQTIGTHGLFCPEPTDYAAFALYMQCLGEQIDSTLQDQLDNFESLLDRPTIIVAASTALAPASGGVGTTGLYDTVIFNNSSFMTLDTILGSPVVRIGSAVGVEPVVEYLPGLYMVGAGTSTTVTGAVTAFSSQVLSVNITDESAPLTDQAVATYTDVVYSIAGVTPGGLNVKGPLILRGTHGVEITHRFNHNNLASTVSAAVGSLLWVTYVGPETEIEVA